MFRWKGKCRFPFQQNMYEYVLDSIKKYYYTGRRNLRLSNLEIHIITNLFADETFHCQYCWVLEG